MTCCENPIDLGCKSACAPITTTIQTLLTDFSIVYNFNGTWVSTPAIVVDGFVTIPAGTFNEASSVTFQIYNNVNAFVGCYKAKILPGNVTFEAKPYTPPLMPFVTNIDFTDGGCSNDTFRGIMTVYFNPDGGIQDGTILDLHHLILHNNNSTPHSIICTTAGVSYINDQLIIYDASLLVTDEINLAVQVTSKNCNHNFTIDAVIDHCENLAPGYENTINSPMVQFVYP